MKEWKRLYASKSGEELVDMVTALQRERRALRQELSLCRALILEQVRPSEADTQIARIDKVLKPRRRTK